MMNSKALKKQLAAAIAMVVVAGVALSSSTYAWFVNNATVTATGAQVTSSTAYSLLISKNDKSGSTYDYETIKTSTDYQENWRTGVELAGNSGLTPVSTIDTILEAKVDGKGAKDDVRFVTSSEWENNLVTKYTEVYKTSTSNGAEDGPKYYYTDTIFLKSGQDAKIYLDKAENDGNFATGIKWPDNNGTLKVYSFDSFIGLTAANANTTYDIKGTTTDSSDDITLEKAQALVKTLRVGFYVTNKTDTSSSAAFKVYQLNGTAISANSANTTNENADGLTKAVGPASGVEAINTATALTPAEVTHNTLISSVMATGSSTGMADDGDPTNALADVKANDEVQVDIYIWMEGCDYDVLAANLATFVNGCVPGIQFGFCIGE